MQVIRIGIGQDNGVTTAGKVEVGCDIFGNGLGHGRQGQYRSRFISCDGDGNGVRVGG